FRVPKRCVRLGTFLFLRAVRNSGRSFFGLKQRVAVVLQANARQPETSRVRQQIVQLMRGRFVIPCRNGIDCVEAANADKPSAMTKTTSGASLAAAWLSASRLSSDRRRPI